MINIMVSILALVAAFIGFIYSLKFYERIKDKMLLVLPIAMIYSTSVRVLRLCNTIGATCIDESALGNAVAVMYILLAIGFWCLYKASAQYNGRK